MSPDGEGGRAAGLAGHKPPLINAAFGAGMRQACASLFALTLGKKAAIFGRGLAFPYKDSTESLLHMNRFAAGVQSSMHAHFLSFKLFHLILMVNIVAFS